MKYINKSFLIFFIAIFINVFLGKNIHNLNASVIYEEANNEQLLNNQKQNLGTDFYILGPGDSLRLKFVGVDELSGVFLIMRDGNIQLPLLGTQNINGYTLNDARKKLIELYKEDLLRPEIDLTLANARPVRVSLIGEVQRPGSYTFTEGEGSRVINSASAGTTIRGYQTVVDAIQKAGGLTFDADITNVKLYRKLPLNVNEGGFKKANLNLLSMIKTGNQNFNPILFDGDIIEVNKAINNIGELKNTPNNLIPETIKIHVIGEVGQPGLIQVDAKTQLSQAILIAGGPNSWRYKDKIQLLRVNRNGSIDVRKISFNKQGISKKDNNISLRNGDIIRVHKNLFSKSTDTLKTFLPPIRDIYSLYGVYKLIE